LLALRGLALACTIQPSVTTALSVMERKALPRGSSLVNSSRQVMQALGIAILGTILSNRIASYFATATAQHIRPDANIAFIEGFNSAFFIVFLIAAGGTVIGFFMPGKPGKWPLKQGSGTRDQESEAAGQGPEARDREPVVAGQPSGSRVQR